MQLLDGILRRSQKLPESHLVLHSWLEGQHEAMQVDMAHRLEGWQMKPKPELFLPALLVAHPLQDLPAHFSHFEEGVLAFHIHGCLNVLVGADEDMFFGWSLVNILEGKVLGVGEECGLSGGFELAEFAILHVDWINMM